MATLTPRQQEVLRHRIARAICWNQVPSSYRDEANRLARFIVAEIDLAGSDGKAAERSVTAIAARLEQSA